MPTATKSLTLIHRTLASLPSPGDILTPSLTSYIFFPITQLLQRNPPRSIPPAVRIGVLDVLSILVLHWMGDGRASVREQIWKMAVSWWKAGGLESEQGVSAWVGCMKHLALTPNGSDRAEFDLELEANLAALQTEMVEFVGRESFLPVLGETVHISIGTFPTRFPFYQCLFAHPPFFFAAIISFTPDPLPTLQLLRSILLTYLCTNTRVLATILPGCVSTITKLLSPQSSRRGGKGVHSDVVVESLAIMAELITSCFNDHVVGPILHPAGHPHLNDLSTLRTWLTDQEDPLSTSTPVPPSPTSSVSSLTSATTHQSNTTFTSTQSTEPSSPLATITPSWIRANASQLLPAFVSLSHLKRHANPKSRAALASLSSSILQTCLVPLESSIQVLTNYLLTLSVDDFPLVSQVAQGGLNAILSDPENQPRLTPVLKMSLLTSLHTLPVLLQSPHQISSPKIAEHCSQITAVAVLGPASRALLQGLLGPLGGVERWGTGLLDCMSFEAAAITEGSGEGEASSRLAKLAWIGADQTGRAPEGSSSAPAETTRFPRIQMSNLGDPAVEDAFSGMLCALGQAGGEEAMFTVEHFMGVAREGSLAGSVVGLRRSAAGVWVAERVLRGIALSEGGQGKKVKKVVRRFVKVLVEMGSHEEVGSPPEESEVDVRGERNLSDGLLKTEYMKGLDPLTTLLDRPSPSSASAPLPSASPAVLRSIVSCHSLSLLTFSAQLLSTAFRPLLLNTLYYLLAHLGSPHSLVRTYASISIDQIAYQIGYASPQNMILDNTDYVINVVSQRLTTATLDPIAPLVLVEMIRLVGEQIVPVVHDIVDEVFDALDAFHGYELVASTLLAVLDSLMKAMAFDPVLLEAPGEGKEDIYPDRPEVKKDLEAFKGWFVRRHEKARTNLEEVLDEVQETSPQRPWGKDPSLPSQEADEASSSLPTTDGPASPEPNRSQTICAQILLKALPFLTHSSPFLRSRVLSLFSSGITVLATAKLEASLLPVVNKAWPYVLNRIKDKEYFVIVEAVGVIERLARLAGEFVGVKIRDEAFPLLKRLVENHLADQRTSSLARRNPNLPHRPSTFSPPSKHSPSHRTIRSILRTFHYIASAVFLSSKQRWEMLLTVKAFLDRDTHDELREEARRVCGVLGGIDGDAVWAGLKGSLRAEADGGEERLGWLAETGWEIEDEVRGILDRLESVEPME